MARTKAKKPSSKRSAKKESPRVPDLSSVKRQVRGNLSLPKREPEPPPQRPPAEPKPEGLTARQRLFIEEYCIDHNATAAAARAGISKHYALELVQKPLIKEEIEAALERRIARTRVNADWVILKLRNIADFNPLRVGTWRGKEFELFDSDDIDPADAACLKSLSVSETESWSEKGQSTSRSLSVSFQDPIKALDLLGEHFGNWDGKPKEQSKELHDALAALDQEEKSK